MLGYILYYFIFSFIHNICCFQQRLEYQEEHVEGGDVRTGVPVSAGGGGGWLRAGTGVGQCWGGCRIGEVSSLPFIHIVYCLWQGLSRRIRKLHGEHTSPD